MAEVLIVSDDPSVNDLKHPLVAEGITLFGRPHQKRDLEQPNVPLHGGEVSRTQCHVRAENGRLVLFDGWPGDRPSTNRTTVNGIEVSTDAGEGVALREGIQARVEGFTLVFRDLPQAAGEADDEKTRFVGDRELDQKTKFVDRKAGSKTKFFAPEATLVFESAVEREDVPRIAIDRRIEAQSIAFKGKEFDLSQATKVEIGRDPKCRIVVIDRDPEVAQFVSRRHAEIVLKEGQQQYVLRNISPNGTRVGDERVVEERPLKDGDRISIGNTVMRFRFKLPEGSEQIIKRPPLLSERAVRIVLGLAAVIFLAGITVLAYHFLTNRAPDRIAAQDTHWSASPAEATSPDSSATPVIADLNGDGFLDVVHSWTDLSNGIGYVAAFDGELGGKLWNRDLSEVQIRGADAVLNLGPVAGPMAVADIDGDGVREVVTATRTGRSSALVVVASGETGEVEWYQEAPARPGRSGEFVGGVALADIDGNGFSDVVTSVWEGDGHGFAVALRGESGGELWRSAHEVVSAVPPALIDITGDGTPDAIFSCAGDIGEVRAVDGRDGTNIWHALVTDQKRRPLSAPAVGEFTGDGVPDVVVMTPDYLVLLLDGRSGSELRRFELKGSMFPPPVVTTRLFAAAPALADLDGDGQLDVVVPHLGSSETSNYVYAIDGGTFERTLWTFPTGNGISFAAPALADLNRDGVADVIVATNPVDVEGSVLEPKAVVQVIDGADGKALGRDLTYSRTRPAFSSAFAAAREWINQPMAFAPPVVESTPLVADLDGDRRLDLVVALTDGSLRAESLNAPSERFALAWGTPRGDGANQARFHAVPRRTERFLLGISGGAVVLGLMLAFTSGFVHTQHLRRKRRREGWGDDGGPSPF